MQQCFSALRLAAEAFFFITLEVGFIYSLTGSDMISGLIISSVT